MMLVSNRVFSRRLHRPMAAVLAVTLTLALGLGGFVEPVAPALGAASACAEPGKDGAATYVSGVPNSYYAGGASVAVGATTVTLGAINAAGSSQAFSIGDLALIIQMQGATISTADSVAYGDGSTGSGYTAPPTAGTYEYVSVRNVVGSTLTVVSKNGGGLINAYTEAAATATQGAQTFQVIRVPQYKTYSVGATLYTAKWNGKSGGVVALDVVGALTLTRPINADGYGFRGGAQNVWGHGYGGAAAASATAIGPDGAYNNDYVYSFTNTYAGTTFDSEFGGPDGFKGEGIAGTPAYVYASGNAYAQLSSSADTGATAPTITTSDLDYYPGGSKGRGAPGNAGGGSTDADANSYTGSPNQYNGGGGGGGNGGSGGLGGQNWSGTASSITNGSVAAQGLGGKLFPDTATQVIMGGGGGAGSNNDGSVGTRSIPVGGGVSEVPTAYTASSGGSGGGIVMLRVGSISGGTVSASGIAAPDPDNDGGGGGGAGGTIVITGTGTITGVTATAAGGSGASATGGVTPNPSSQYDGPNTTYTNYYAHGPGGGGGGGVVINSGTVAATVSGGTNGETTANNYAYGATSGSAGVHITSGITPASIPGARSGAECEELLVAKRFTSINGTAQTSYTADGSTDTATGTVVDTNPYWPTSGGNPDILGLITIAAGSKPSDKIEYSIYYLSAGGSPVSGAAICDFVPPDTTLINAYNTTASPTAPMEVVSGFAAPTTAYYGTVTTGSGVYTVSTTTGTGAPAGCGTAPKSSVTGKYSSAAIYYSPGAIPAFAVTDSGYGKVAFTVQVN